MGGEGWEVVASEVAAMAAVDRVALAFQASTGVEVVDGVHLPGDKGVESVAAAAVEVAREEAASVAAVKAAVA